MQGRALSEKLRGVWSATPTPLTDTMKVDTVAIRRLVEHHVRLGVNGLFLAGTCGEGPWMPDENRRMLLKSVAACAAGRLALAFQVTDNSADRMLDNVRAARDNGADLAVVAPPLMMMAYSAESIRSQRLCDLYLRTIRKSALPIGIYDRGSFSPTVVPDAVMRKILAEPNVVLLKDSSMDPNRCRLAVAARRKRPALGLLTGYEFGCVPYLEAGYDGLLLGGGIFNGYLAARMMAAAAAGDLAAAQRLQDRMNRMMWSVYGGRKLTCWLSGLKKLLVEMGIFRTWKSYLDYPLTDSCVKAIRRVIARDADVLTPWTKT